VKGRAEKIHPGTGGKDLATRTQRAVRKEKPKKDVV